MVLAVAVLFSLAVASPPLSRPLQEPPPFELTARIKEETLTELIKEMNARYVLPEAAKTIEASLRTWMASSEYSAVTDPVAFAAKVNEVLKGGAKDAHLRFRYSPSVLPPRSNPREPSADEMKRYRQAVRFTNADFSRVERLRGNVGYIKFQGFEAPEDMRRPLAGAMRFLGDCDAMIVDLRENGGGDPAGVQLFCSYFFDEKPVHLNSIYFREGNRTREFWTLKKVDGPRLPKVPLYVLTSKRTGSGAEECAYNFQQLKRATIVGSSTWGGANPGGMVRLGDHFGCFIPIGRAINPYTKTNWEGVGVQPDEAVEPAKALEHAHVLALKALIARTSDPELKKDLQTILDQLVAGG
ncbi:MAG: S41 family peptidase [Fimbriimonadaceae bacterium]|nr:S41 family peptidase [Fimbriimonadaceae bacterium]